MRIYKPSYTKPLPEGAKAFARKGKRFVKYKDARGHTTEAPLTKKGDKILCDTEHWHIGFDDNQGVRRELKAFTSEQATQRLADRIQQLLNYKANNQPLDAELQKFIEQMSHRMRDGLIGFGLLDARTAGKTLAALVGTFEKHLLAKERAADYIKETIAVLNRIFEGCEFFSDISASRIENYLKDLRDKGISFRRSNVYLQSVKHFCKWAVESDLASQSPVRHLKLLNVKLDRRKERRAITVDELRRLIETTAAGPESKGMSGYERSLLYQVAVYTGLRANEIRSLTIGSFNFDNLTVTVKAGCSKHRRDDILPLNPDLAVQLKEFFKGKLPGVKAFGGSHKQLTNKTANMIRKDLEAAGIPYKDESGKEFDFHALRHQTGSLLAASGVHPKVAQSIMRHSDINLTMSLYTHTLRGQESEAVGKMPDLSQPSKKESRQATGTDDEILSKSCFQDAHRRTQADTGGKKNRDNEPQGALGADNKGAIQTLKPLPKEPNPPSPITQAPENKRVTKTDQQSSESEKQKLAEILFSDSDLQQVVKAWPNLSEQVKSIVLKLVEIKK